MGLQIKSYPTKVISPCKTHNNLHYSVTNVSKPTVVRWRLSKQCKNSRQLVAVNITTCQANPSTPTAQTSPNNRVLSFINSVPKPMIACCAFTVAAMMFASSAHAAPAKAVAAASDQGIVALAKSALSFILHLDVHLGDIIAKYGTTTYAILFAIVFCETGLVVTPFLPGDSLLFATGALAALGKLNVFALLAIYITAATLGDAVNYAIGNYFGSKAIESRFIKKEYIEKTEEFYTEYGGKTVVLARFVPIVRTFAPFVAGIGSMSYAKFGLYNIVGAVLWTAICTGAGFAFGNVPAVHENFSLVVLGIVAVSVLPIVYEVLAAKKSGGGKGGVNGGNAGSVGKDGGSLRVDFRQ